VKEPLKSYFPVDDANTRKNPLYVKLFDSLDRADGRMTDSEKKVSYPIFITYVLTILVKSGFPLRFLLSKLISI